MAQKKVARTPGSKQEVKKVQKQKKSGKKREKGEIISRDELEKRKGLTGDETALLSVYLHKFEAGEMHIGYSKKLKDLAQYIYDREELYVTKHGGYKLMEVSSIETALSVIRKANRERKEEEEEEEKQAKKRA